MYWKLTPTHTFIIKNSMAHWFGPKFKALEFFFSKCVATLYRRTDWRTVGKTDTIILIYSKLCLWGFESKSWHPLSLLNLLYLWTKWWPTLWSQAIFVWCKNFECSSIRIWTKLHDCTNGHALNFVCGGLDQIHDTSSGFKQSLLEKT